MGLVDVNEASDAEFFKALLALASEEDTFGKQNSTKVAPELLQFKLLLA